MNLKEEERKDDDIQEQITNYVVSRINDDSLSFSIVTDHPYYGRYIFVYKNVSFIEEDGEIFAEGEFKCIDTISNSIYEYERMGDRLKKIQSILIGRLIEDFCYKFDLQRKKEDEKSQINDNESED